MLPRFRQNQDWCTNGPCAGSINPIIPWSICEGSSQERCVIVYLPLKTVSAGAAGMVSGSRVPGELISTHTSPPRPSPGQCPAQIPSTFTLSCPATDATSPPSPLHASTPPPPPPPPPP